VSCRYDPQTSNSRWDGMGWDGMGWDGMRWVPRGGWCSMAARFGAGVPIALVMFHVKPHPGYSPVARLSDPERLFPRAHRRSFAGAFMGRCTRGADKFF
jgi:hypothetical protein